MAARGLGVDEGTETLKAVEVEMQSGLAVPRAAVSVQASDTFQGMKEALASSSIKQRRAVAGLTGKDLVIRYHQVPAVPDWQLRKIMGFEIEEISRQSGDTLCGDFNLLPVGSDLSQDDTVLLALSREQRLGQSVDSWKSQKVRVQHFTPNALGLYHAFRMYGPAVEGDVVVANIGRQCSDLAILRDGELLYARSVNTAGNVLTEALVERFNVSFAKAEALKREMGDLRPRAQRQTKSPQQEKVAYALEGAAGRLFQMIQSTIQLAKNQVQLNRLEPQRVYLTGGTAAMPGLAESLSAGLGMAVEVFDPLEEYDLEMQGPASTLELTVAAGLAVMAVADDGVSVEVQNDALRRGEEFRQRHLYTVLAFLVVVAFLGNSWLRMGDDYERAARDSRVLRGEQQKRKSNAAKLESLVEVRDALAQQVDSLEKRKAAGEGIVRTLSQLVRNVPDELWIQRVELEMEGAAVGKAARTPVVLVEGKGRSLGEGGVDQVYRGFIDGMRRGLAFENPARFVDTPPTQREEFEFRLKLNFVAEDAVKSGES